MRWSRRRTAGVVVLVLVAAGVAVVATRGDSGPARATLTLALDRPLARVGEDVTITVTYRNTGSRTIDLRQVCGGGFAGHLSAQPSAGAIPASPFTGRLGAFRDLAVRSRPPTLPVDVRKCADQRSSVVPLKPGRSLAMTATWQATSPAGSVFDGTLTISGFDNSGGSGGEVLSVDATPVTLRLTGGDPKRLTQAQAVDVALHDEDFARDVARSDPAHWGAEGQPVRYGYDGAHPDAYSVLLAQRVNESGYDGKVVLVSSTTGNVVGTYGTALIIN